MNVPRPEYPRPDFAREHWQSLNGRWDFSFDEPVYDKTITVPFCYQAKASGIGEDSFHETVWYRRSFTVEAAPAENGRLLLHFGAVDYEARVWVNGTFIGEHRGGHTSFCFDITEAVKPGGENLLVVQATDGRETDKPRGKQSWTGELFGCWYTPTTGIWQSVWLEAAGPVYLRRLKVTPDLPHLSALCEVLVSTTAEVRVELEASMEREGGRQVLGQAVALCKNGYGKAAFTFEDLDIRRDTLLWSPEKPNLIGLRAVVKGPGADDAVDSYFGLRDVRAHAGKLALNGAAYYQRLVLDQGYWPDSLLTPPSDEAIIEDIKLTKAMGFNGARKHQKIEDPRYYYWADKLGLLVWGELPSAYSFSDTAIQNSSRELTEFVARDYNHPSIVAWVPVNESWGVRDIMHNAQQQDYARALYYLLKALDPVRLVSGNDGWEQTEATDICALHDYSLFPGTMNKYDDMDDILKSLAEHRYLFAEGNAYAGQPVMMTEYGGISFAKDAKAGWGYYEDVPDEDAFIARLEPITEYLIRSGKFAGFCYTQLTDVMQEVNGLLTPDRRPKLPVEKLAGIFARRIY